MCVCVCLWGAGCHSPAFWSCRSSWRMFGKWIINSFMRFRGVRILEFGSASTGSIHDSTSAELSNQASALPATVLM